MEGIPKCDRCNSVVVCVSDQPPNRTVEYYCHCGFCKKEWGRAKTEEEAWERYDV